LYNTRVSSSVVYRDPSCVDDYGIGSLTGQTRISSQSDGIGSLIGQTGLVPNSDRSFSLGRFPRLWSNSDTVDYLIGQTRLKSYSHLGRHQFGHIRKRQVCESGTITGEPD
jgi:hypothetical protein